jgi:hypothetical protein
MDVSRTTARETKRGRMAAIPGSTGRWPVGCRLARPATLATAIALHLGNGRESTLHQRFACREKRAVCSSVGSMPVGIAASLAFERTKRVSNFPKDS